MLQVTHPDADLSGVPARLGLPVNYSCNKGDLMPVVNGSPYVATGSCCNMPVSTVSAQTLSEALSCLLDVLRPHREYLIGLADRGAKLLLFAGAGIEPATDPDDEYLHAFVEWSVLKGLADLHVSLDLTVTSPKSA
jgi:hypothetical protein